MSTHKHYFDPSLRIRTEKTNRKIDIKNSIFNEVEIDKRKLNYFEGTYTNYYVSENIDTKLDLLNFRFYIPNQLHETEKDKDQWNRKFCMPFEEIYKEVQVSVVTPTRECVHAYCLNHNLRILNKSEIELVTYSIDNKLGTGEHSSENNKIYYIPFVAFADAGGFSDCLIDFYVRVPKIDRIKKFQDDINNYLNEQNYDIYEHKGFSNLGITGYEYDYPHFDREMQIMYYNRIEFLDSTNRLIAQL